MKEIAQDRLKLAVVLNLNSKLKDYVNHLQHFFKGEIEEKDLDYLKTMLGSDSWYPRSQIAGYIQALQTLPQSEAQAFGRLMANIHHLTEESLTTASWERFKELWEQLRTLWQEWSTVGPTLFSDLKNDYQKLSSLLLMQSKTWSSSNQVVFHGIKFEYAGGILESEKIQGYTTQRYWADGKRRQDHDPEYEDSFWMKGISTTRSLEFAMNWAPVVLVLDLSKIKKNKEVIPYAWNYHMKASENFKKETEEFIVLKKTERKFKNFENPEFLKEYEEGILSDDPEVVEHYKKEYSKHDQFNFKSPEGELNLNGIIMGVFLVGYIIDIYGIDHPVVQQIIQHPKFIGILEN